MFVLKKNTSFWAKNLASFESSKTKRKNQILTIFEHKSLTKQRTFIGRLKLLLI